MARWDYYILAGDEGAALREARRRVAIRNDGAKIILVQGLLRAGDIKEAIELAGQIVPPKAGEVLSDSTVAFAIAEGDPSRARQLADAVGARGGAGLINLDAELVLRMLGDNAAAQAAARRLRDKAPSWPWRHEWYRKLLEYDCGSISADGLLEFAGASRLNQCEANFHIALTCLGDGDRATARVHFQKSADPLGAIYFNEWQWSRVFLARMDQDPQWPRWIRTSGSENAARSAESHQAN
jgi:hypothetical protein